MPKQQTLTVISNILEGKEEFIFRAKMLLTAHADNHCVELVKPTEPLPLNSEVVDDLFVLESYSSPIDGLEMMALRAFYETSVPACEVV